MVIPYKKNLRELSKKLRNNATEAERRLWEFLRLKRTGYVFHRQKPVGDYIVDFYCSRAKLIIEIDGEYHTKDEATKNDKARDAYMQSLGLTTVRFTNFEVMKDAEQVAEKIRKILLDSPFDKGDNP